MNAPSKHTEYDVIIIGSGTCGSSIARELAKENKRVLILEAGGDTPLAESFTSLASIVDEVEAGENGDSNKKLKSTRALTKGGSSALYFAVADEPPVERFKNELNIDIAQELEETKSELPITEIPDDMISEASKRLRDAAADMGYPWRKKRMLVDLSQCKNGYNYDAKWKARSFLDDAIASGAELVTNATANQVITEGNRAVGVEYSYKSGLFSRTVAKVFAPKIVLAAGVLSTPLILRASGVKSIGKDGFVSGLTCMAFGLLPGLKSQDNFVANMSMSVPEHEIEIGDGNVSAGLFRMMMLAELKFGRLFSFEKNISAGGVVHDELGGEILDDGAYHKPLNEDEIRRLKKAEEISAGLLQKCGAKNIAFMTHGAGNVRNVLHINKHVDSTFETEIQNLHVCDGSIIPEFFRESPTLTLVSFSKYLSKHLLKTL